MVPGFKLTELLDFNPDEGIISFRGNRMLIFQADALSELRKEMIHTLGEDIARGMLARFGYQCGLNNATTFQNYYNFKNDDDWMLAGPLMHALEGSVHVSIALLEYDRQKGTFLMQGNWHNSYEAEHHLRLYGPAREPVCWTLSGYASGYATGFMGRKVICVETMCKGMGDPYCRYELRDMESWNGEASRNIKDLKQCQVIKSLQKMVSEERERANLWCKMSNAVLDISTNLDSTNLPEKLVRYARELMTAERAVLAVTENTKRILLYEALEQNIVNTKVLASGSNPVCAILKTGKPVITNNNNIVGVPLFSKKQLIGAMAVINKKNGEQLSQQDQDFLMVLGAQAAVALDNARLYERTNEKLQEKVTEMFNLNEMLSKEKASLQKSATVHNQLTSLVLEGQGLDEISRNLAQIIGKEILVTDHFFQVLSCSQAGKADRESITDIWNKAVKNQDIKKEQLALAFNTKLFRFAFPVKERVGRGNVVVLPVIAGKDYLGNVATIEEEDLLSELDCMALEHAATVIALEMLKQKAAFEAERRMRKDFFEELLTGNYDSEDVIKRRAARLGLDLNKPYRLMSIDISYDKRQDGQISTVENFLEVVDRPVKNVCNCIFLSTSKKDIVGLLPVIDDSGSDDNKLFEMARALESEMGANLAKYQWWVGIGSICSQLSEFAGSYKEACVTIDIAKSLNCKNRCLAYENLGIFSLIHIDVDRFHKFVRRVIGPLIDYDEKNNSQLVETLKLYVENNCNLLRAARNGYLSPSTVKYRMRRVAEIADIDLDDAKTVLLVHMALELIEGI